MYKLFKRLFDISSSLMLFIVISPLFLTLYVLVYLKHGAPVFFRQKRTGMNMKPFYLIKFRSMSNTKDKEGKLLPDHLRVTKFGIWLRSSSLDELPELFNIIRGDMSVIGPRPLPTIYDDYYKADELSRFKVRGGLISPDVKEGIPVVSWDKQLSVEAQYGNNVCLKEDIAIFFAVFKTLMKRAEDNFGSFERVALNIERAPIQQK